MRKILLALMVLGSAHALIAQSETPEPNPPFHPAEARSVADIETVTPCVAPGTVVLDLLIAASGEVQKIEVRRDLACFAQVAIQAVKDWKFLPATFAGKPIASRMPVAVTFDPVASSGPVTLTPLVPQSTAAIQAEFQPAEVTRAAFPHLHPGYALVAGAVVLEATLGTKGEVEETTVLLDLPPFTATAKAVVGDWRFIPATLNGHPVRSKILLVFVSPPVSNIP